MSIRGDERGQSIQVGAILLFGVLIILLATYQAFVVPNQNREVEARHLAEISTDMAELRDAIVSLPGRATDRSVTLQLGTTYPSRVVGLNPGPPTGAIRTGGTGTEDVNVTVANAVAAHAEVDDRWDGTNRSYNSGSLAYTPNYNEFRNAPTIGYDNSLLYHRFRDGTITRSGQRVIDGREITLLALNGSLDATRSGSISMDLRAVSASDRRIAVANEAGENVVVRFASRLDASQWEEQLGETGELLGQGGHVVSVTDRPIPGTPFSAIAVELEAGVTYSLGMAKVGVGTQVADEPVTYLTEVGPDGISIPEGTTKTVRFEARDRLNNPVAGVTVNATIEPAPQNGALASATATTDSDGRAEIEYQAADVDGPSPTFQLNVSFERVPGSDFRPSAPANASVNVTVQNTDAGGGGGGSGGAYTTTWLDPSGQAGVTCPDGADGVCTLDASVTSVATLTMATSPIADGASVDFAVNDTSTGVVNPGSGTTDASGEEQTDLSPVADGGLAVFTSSGGSGDDLIVRIINTVNDLVYNNDANADVPSYGTGGEEALVTFTVTNQRSSDVTITGFTLNSTSLSPSGEINEDQFGDFHEFWIDTDGDGASDGNVDMGAGDAISEGQTEPLDVQATIAQTETAEIRLYDFDQSTSGNPESMVGEDATVAIHYEDGSGTRFTKTIQLTNIPD